MMYTQKSCLLSVRVWEEKKVGARFRRRGFRRKCNYGIAERNRGPTTELLVWRSGGHFVPNDGRKPKLPLSTLNTKFAFGSSELCEPRNLRISGSASVHINFPSSFSPQSIKSKSEHDLQHAPDARCDPNILSRRAQAPSLEGSRDPACGELRVLGRASNDVDERLLVLLPLCEAVPVGVLWLSRRCAVQATIRYDPIQIQFQSRPVAASFPSPSRPRSRSSPRKQILCELQGAFDCRPVVQARRFKVEASWRTVKASHDPIRSSQVQSSQVKSSPVGSLSSTSRSSPRKQTLWANQVRVRVQVRVERARAPSLEGSRDPACGELRVLGRASNDVDERLLVLLPLCEAMPVGVLWLSRQLVCGEGPLMYAHVQVA